MVWDIMVCLTPAWVTMVLDTLDLDTLVLDITVWDTVFLSPKSLPLMLLRMLSYFYSTSYGSTAWCWGLYVH